MEERFFLCETCGNLFMSVIASGVIPYCCGDEMSLLEANIHEGNADKHLPVVDMKDDAMLRVRVGSTLHPMTQEHNIKFICLVTTSECIIHYFAKDDVPDVIISFRGKPLHVYSYCNQHGLWRLDLDAST